MKLPKFRLKSAKLSDVRSVFRLFSRIRQIDRSKVEHMISEKKVLVLKDGKKKVRAAFAFSIFTITGYFTFMYISKLAVDPNMQGQGIGTFLLSQIRQKSLRIGAVAFFLYSADKVRKFYLKNKLNSFWRIFWWKNKAV